MWWWQWWIPQKERGQADFSLLSDMLQCRHGALSLTWPWTPMQTLYTLDPRAGWLLSSIWPTPEGLEPSSINWDLSRCLPPGCSWVTLSFGHVASSQASCVPCGVPCLSGSSLSATTLPGREALRMDGPVFSVAVVQSPADVRLTPQS